MANQHPSLPARPPPSRNPSSHHPAPHGYSGGFQGGMAPHQVATPPPGSHPSGYGTPPVGYGGGGYQAPQYAQQGYYPTPDYNSTAVPTIRNPFAPTPTGTGTNGREYDPDEQAQLAQWQSAYAAKEDSLGKNGKSGANASFGNANLVQLGNRTNGSTPVNGGEADTAADSNDATSTATAGGAKKKTVVREAGGKKWEDETLLEWDPTHHRLFIGNLAGETTDDSLLKAFQKYSSVSKARVIRDKRTTKSKGYGFVAFADGDDYFQAFKEMQGKYIGSHPVTIKPASREFSATVQKEHHHYKKGKGGKGGKGGYRSQDHHDRYGGSGSSSGGAVGTSGKHFGGHADTGAGVHKRQPSKPNRGGHTKVLG